MFQSPTNQSGLKRRKLRKGTHSCWQCKRRKMRCIFPPHAGICYGCQQRGCLCVGQDVELPESNALSPPSRIPRERHSGGINTTRDITGCPSIGPRNVDLSSAESILHLLSPKKIEHLTAILYDALPSCKDAEQICAAARHPSVIPHVIMTIPYSEIDRNGSSSIFALPPFPSPPSHPVLTAKYMLLLASVIQHLTPDLQRNIAGVSEPPRAIMLRMFQLATKLIASNEDFVSSIEGLECVIIESVYHATRGNMRRSWLSCRRALGIAQLMGLDRTDGRPRYQVLQQNVKHHTHHIWFRIVQLDRILSLLLGLAQGSTDREMIPDSAHTEKTLLGRIERIHSAIASRILERNDSRLLSQETHFAVTQAIDTDLQQAAMTPPNQWWMIPTLNNPSTPSTAVLWDMARLLAQIFHFNLLNQLHLPYMLCSSSDPGQYEYSRITCVNASREIISRFISLRIRHGMSYSCRINDFITIMAAMTLLLAHIDSRRRWTVESLLSYQYHTDRAMIEQVQKTMEQVHSLNGDDVLSEQSADLLRRLLIIADDSSQSPTSRAVNVIVQMRDQTTASGLTDDSTLRVHIPYFGIITITREGITRTAVSRDPLETSTLQKGNDRSVHPAPSSLDFTDQASEWAERTIPEDAGSTPTFVDNDLINIKTTSSSASTTNPMEFDSSWLQSDLPSLAADGEYWAFQGIDLAFFETLMNTGNLWNDE